MSVLFMGGEMSSFVPSAAEVYERTGSAGTWNSSFARCFLSTDDGTTYAESADFGTGTDLWLHMDMQVYTLGSGSGSTVRFHWMDGGGTAKIRLVQIYSSNTLRAEYWNGSAWTSAGSATVNMISRQTIDMNVVCNSATGSIKVYVAGTLRINSGSIDLSGITALGKIRILGVTNSIRMNTYASQVIVADEPTIGWRLLTRYVNGAGADSAWTGAYTDIDEITYNDADFILSGTNNQVSTFTQTGPSITGYTVRAVGVAARARRGASGPQNLQLALRSSGTTYFSSSKALDLGYGAFLHVWDQNPATTADWINTAIDTLQPGVKSIA